MTAAVGPRLRLGVEVLQANMFGKYSSYKVRATLVTPVVEFEFSPGKPEDQGPPSFGHDRFHHAKT